MFFYISGEGNSDFGNDTDQPGPLLEALRQLAASASEEEFSYSIVSRHDLAQLAKKMTGNPKAMNLRGRKTQLAGTLSVQRYAQALAAMTKKAEIEAGAVLFHDCDYSSQVNGERYYKQMVMAVQHGFALADALDVGVPMIPNPRSESWLLCHYQEVPYQDGRFFEDVPANDSADGCGKKLLASFFKCKVKEIYQHIQPDEIDWLRIKAPSFLFFKNRFVHVVERLTHQAFSIQEEETLMQE